MPEKHKEPTIAFRPSAWERAVIEQRAALSGLHKKDFILAYATSQAQACLHLATARGSNTPPLGAGYLTARSCILSEPVSLHRKDDVVNQVGE